MKAGITIVAIIFGLVVGEVLRLLGAPWWLEVGIVALLVFVAYVVLAETMLPRDPR